MSCLLGRLAIGAAMDLATPAPFYEACLIWQQRTTRSRGIQQSRGWYSCPGPSARVCGHGRMTR
jgi:hypothetical protein